MKVAASAVLIEVSLSEEEAQGGLPFGRGAGSVLDANGTVLTAYHVVRSATSIRAVTVIINQDGSMFIGGPVVPMRIAATAPDYDAALLVPRYPDRPLAATPMPLAPRQAREGEAVHGLLAISGWRGGEVLHVDFPMPDLATIVESSIISRHGDSGSPIVDRCGRLVGFMCRGRDWEESFFIPALPALDALGAAGPLP